MTKYSFRDPGGEFEWLQLLPNREKSFHIRQALRQYRNKSNTRGPSPIDFSSVPDPITEPPVIDSVDVTAKLRRMADRFR